MKLPTTFLVNMFPKLNIYGELLINNIKNSQESWFNGNVFIGVVVFM